MLHAVRPSDRPITPRRPALPTAAGLVGALAMISLAGCPAPPPRSADAAPRSEPAPVAAPAPEPTPPPTELAPRRRSPAPEPAPVPDPTAGPPLPPALAAEGVRPVVQSLWRALEAVDGGDADALSRVMLPQGRWFPPGSPAESVSGATDLRRAMGPWGSREIALDVRRVIDLGGRSFVVQVAASAKEGAPAPRHELLLVVEAGGDGIAEIRHYGDPLGPVRSTADPEEPLDLGPVGEVELERGPQGGSEETVALTQSLTLALDGRKDTAASALLAEDVVLHDVTARRTRRGRPGYLAGYGATLGDAGHLALDRHHAGPRWVVIEGAVHGRESTPEGAAIEHGFADVHRVVDGAIVETWHYVNRRGRPHTPRVQP